MDTLVYIGVDEYEILSISEDMVRLRNQKYPIFTEEMSREEFERKLRENPANDSLKKRKVQTGEIKEKLQTEVIEEQEFPQQVLEKERFQETEEVSLQELDLPAEKENAQDLSPAWEKAMPRRTDSFDLHPELPQSQRLQFQIIDDVLG